jgi:glycerol-3-phosphate dehydrogenase
MTYDLLIIGGGINGASVAREAALNGLSVLLVEKDDLAAHTSSASTKLIHGGLRYLEYYEFRLVREALQERERLLRLAPELIHPLAFVLPHENAVRPWWMVRLGLAIYDRLGGRIRLPHSRGLRADDTAYQAPLARKGAGFVYFDAATDDAALTRAIAADAVANGAEIATHTELVSARRDGDFWRATLTGGREATARIMVNAAGPWVGTMLGRLGINTKAHVRLVKGSHITVPRLYEGDHAYMLQQPDKRIVFAFPWAGQTAIGTTDIAVDSPEATPADADEIAYLCAAVDRYFTKQVTPADVTGSWSGVRPLYDDGASEAKAVTREYVLELDTAGAPLLSVFGGKITTARRLGEDVLGKLGYPSTATRDRPLHPAAEGFFGSHQDTKAPRGR